MKVMAVFKPVKDEEKQGVKDDLKKIKAKMKNGIESFDEIFGELNGLMDRIKKTAEAGGSEDPDNSTIVILPQYVTSFNMGKGFGLNYDMVKANQESGKLSNLTSAKYNKNMYLTTLDDANITLTGKIVPFDLMNFLKEANEQTKGDMESKKEILMRQKQGYNVLEYVANWYMVNQLGTWGIDDQVRTDPDINKAANQNTSEITMNEEVTKVEEKFDLSKIEVNAFHQIRKSLFLVIFKESTPDTDTDGDGKPDKVGNKTPGEESMKEKDYLFKLLGTNSYIPVKYVYFPEVEISGYSETLNLEGGEGEFTVIVKRPGDSKYPIEMGNPMAKVLSEVWKLAGNAFEMIGKAVSEGGKGNEKNKF